MDAQSNVEPLACHGYGNFTADTATDCFRSNIHPFVILKGQRKKTPFSTRRDPVLKEGAMLDAVDISSDDSDIGEDEKELAEPFDPSSFYSNAFQEAFA